MFIRLKPFIYILFGLVVLVLIAEGVFYLHLKNKRRELPKPITPFRKESSESTIPFKEGGLEVKSSYLEIGKKVLAWLDKQRDERGVYHLGKVCKKDGGCEVIAPDNRVGLSAIWARFRHYRITREPEDLNILEKDFGLYTDPSKVNVIQNNFWNCKLMYEMWQSDLFSKKQKEKIEKICWRGLYNPNYLEEVGKAEDKRPDLKGVIERKNYKTYPTVLSAVGVKLIEYAAYSSDFVSRSLWKSNDKDLKLAKGFFNKALALYDSEKEEVYIEGKCLLGITSLDMYRLLKDQDYLNFAKAFFEKERIEEVCLTEEGLVTPNRCQGSLFESTTCAMFANDLYDLTKEEKYKIFKEETIKKIIDKKFNSKDGVFEDTYDKEKTYRMLKNNSLIVGVLPEEGGTK